ncbi:hypothetical protein CAPTEDRAFT_198866 [Capitella teleta]|uniref:Bcl-2 Bcl-2 homology region 1-3 domain-containing protein n=1 Tax=Capitella teleta TaxID=283909 RepID=R7T3X7_CAPTE|nr:hypothetical protein CAPTEDRAFT_198866 [Capitella teleta]|eukprot:ELT87488.1 hypothetical protein CAPTEDRAFT_198866 [Capitella teleta]
MDRDDKTRLRANLTTLRTIPVGEISDRLWVEGVLDDDDLDSFKVNKAPREISSDLFKTIIRKGQENHYAILCTVLKDEGYEHVVQQLNATDLTQYNYNFDASPQKKMQALCEQLANMQQDIYAENEYLKSKLGTINRELKSVEEREARLRESKAEMDPNIVAYINERITGRALPSDSVDAAGVGSLGSSFIPPYIQEWMNLRKPVMNANATEQIARQLGADIVSYKCMSDPPPAITTYATRMRAIVDEILVRYEESFVKFMDVLYLDEINGLQTLWNVADQVFADFKEGENPNWGHVCTLYAFGAYVAKHSFNGEADPQMANFVGDFLGYYVSKKLGATIVKTGGWNAFLQHFDRTASPDGRSMMLIFMSLAVWVSTIIFSLPGNEF